MDKHLPVAASASSPIASSPAPGMRDPQPASCRGDGAGQQLWPIRDYPDHPRFVRPMAPVDAALSAEEEPFGDITPGAAIAMLVTAYVAAFLIWFVRPRTLVLMALAIAAYFGGQYLRVML